MFKQLRLTVGFFTVIPAPGDGSLAEIFSGVYLLPLVAAVLGVVEGLAALALIRAFPPLLTGALVLSLGLLATGLHHSDGLADMGDAIMARGDRERRRQVLKDRTMGMGAVGALLLTYFISWAAIAEIVARMVGIELLSAMAIAEVAARLCMLTVALLSEPSHQGSGSAFIGAIKGWRGGAALGISGALLLAGAVWLPLGSLLATTCVVVATSLIVVLASGWFGGAGGDVLGAAVEWGRMAALLGLALALSL